MGNQISQRETEKCKLQKLRHKHIEHLMQLEDALKEDDLKNGVEPDSTLDKIDPARYDLPFENLAFEGGGAKGMGHVGAVKYLEEIGLLPKIVRLAGASAGAMQAVLLAVGCDSSELKTYLGEDWNEILRDGGLFSGVRNLFKRFGWHPGNRVYEWFGKILRQKTGSEDITFEQVRKKYGRELCVVVANLNLMTAEYCHPKTTPDMPVRVAVRMSMSLPGWYLSMDKADNFIARLQPLEDLPTLLEDRFNQAPGSNKTLGFLLYTQNDREYLRESLERRVKSNQPEKPSVETKLYKNWLKKKEDMVKAKRINQKITDAMNSFLGVIDKCNMNKDMVISRKELEIAMQDEAFTKNQAQILFGEGVSPEEAFHILDEDGTGEIHYSELVSFLEDHGINIRHRSLGIKRSVVNSLQSYAATIQDTLLLNIRKMSTKPSDIDRTVGINTGHVDVTDFDLEEEDKEFVVMRGYNACRAFLQRYIADNNLQPREDKGKPVGGEGEDTSS